MNEWISVKDRLPTLGEKVIICIDGVVQETIFTFDECDDYYFWALDDIDDDPDELPKLQLTDMWMPLPEPPKL